GDIDAAIPDYLATKEGLSLTQIDALLNKQSGLIGISGLTNDMRELLDEAREHADRRALLAIDIFCYRVRKYIGAYLAAMNGADAIVFSGGVGGRSPGVRRRVCGGVAGAGVGCGPGANRRVAKTGEGRLVQERAVA